VRVLRAARRFVVSRLATSSRERGAVRVVVVVAAVACLADQPPRWSMDTKVPTAAVVPPGRALRVTVEASHEPSLFVKSGGSATPWEDRATPRTSWPGHADLFVDAGAELGGASISDRCVSGGGLCSGCDPPPGSFVRILSTTEVDVWSVTASAPAPAGTGSRVEVELEVTRDPVVRTVPASSGACMQTSPSVAPSAPPPTASTARHLTYACWVDTAATVHAMIRGACPAGPCSAPAGEAVAITRVARAP